MSAAALVAGVVSVPGCLLMQEEKEKHHLSLLLSAKEQFLLTAGIYTATAVLAVGVV